MSWLSKNLKKLKIKDFINGVKTVSSVLPGGDLIRKGIEAGEKQYKDTKKSMEKKKTPEVKTSEIEEKADKQPNYLLFGIAAVILFMVMKK